MSGGDIVLRGGRVLDPETGLDELRDVVIAGDRIAAVAEPGVALPGAVELDVRGRVVAPGFIDLHSHTRGLPGLWLRVCDGVTTALELEAGALPVDDAYRRQALEGSPIHYGFSASWALARRAVLTGAAGSPGLTQLLGDRSWQAHADLVQRQRIVDVLGTALADGAIGIGILLGYCPEADAAEYLDVAALAASAGVPTFTHVRELDRVDAGLMGAQELVAAALATAAHMHLCHVHSTSVRHLDEVTALLERARSQGVRVTTEAYPYGASATSIGAPFLKPEGLHRLGIEPSDICYVPTGERPGSLARLAQLRATDPGGLAVIDFLREADPDDVSLLVRALVANDAAVASDAMPLVAVGSTDVDATWPIPHAVKTHPRTAGTFARVLRWFVRDLGVLSLAEAVRRCTLVPATVLAQAVPGMRSKGRLQAGCDADLVAFDPAQATDRATFADSCAASTGIDHVLVAGEFVVRDGVPDRTARPGRPVRGA